MRLPLIIALCALLPALISCADEGYKNEFVKTGCVIYWYNGTGTQFIAGYPGACDSNSQSITASSLSFNWILFRDQASIYTKNLTMTYKFLKCEFKAKSVFVDGKPGLDLTLGGKTEKMTLPVRLDFTKDNLKLSDEFGKSLEKSCSWDSSSGRADKNGRWPTQYSQQTGELGGFPADLYTKTTECYSCGFAVYNESLMFHGTNYSEYLSDHCVKPGSSTKTVKCPAKCFSYITEVRDGERIIGHTAIRGCEPGWDTRLVEKRPTYKSCKSDNCNDEVPKLEAEPIECYDCGYSNSGGANLGGRKNEENCVTGGNDTFTKMCEKRCFQYTKKSDTGEEGGSIVRGCTEDFSPLNPKPDEYLSYSVCGNQFHSKSRCNDNFDLEIPPFQCFSCAYTTIHDGNLTVYGESYANDKTCLDDKLADKTLCSTRCFYYAENHVDDNEVSAGGFIIRGCQPSLRDLPHDVNDTSHPPCKTSLCNKLPPGFTVPDSALPKDVSDRLGYICTPDAIAETERLADKCWKEVKAKQMVIFVILGVSGLELLFIALTIFAFILAICHKKRKRRRRHGKKSGSKSKASKTKDSKTKDAKGKESKKSKDSKGKKEKDSKKAKPGKAPTKLPV